jgi:tripartite-type tricarboxylate transporter receptor subunit TctC
MMKKRKPGDAAMDRRTLLTGLAALAPAMAASRAKAAPAYPDAAVRVIVPYPPGGTTDIVGRIIAARLTERLGQSFFVENRSGASGMIGTQAVAASAPDGGTLLLASIAQAINVAVYKTQPFNFAADFAPISQIATTPNVLSVHPSVPAKTLDELLALVRARPGKYNFGSTSVGGSPHMCGELLKVMAHVNIVHIPYRGAAPMLTDLLGGQIPMAFDNLPSSLPLIRSGQIRGIAVTSATRSAMAPDLPTFAESGLPGYEVSGWYGLLAPAKTPPDIIAALHQGVVDALAEPATRSKLLNSGAEPVGSSPAEYAATIRNEIAKWTNVVAMTGVHAQ